MAGLSELFRLKDFHAMSKDELTKEAKQNGIQAGISALSSSTGDTGNFDREYVITQLIARETRIRNWWMSTLAFAISCLSLLVAVATLAWRISSSSH